MGKGESGTPDGKTTGLVAAWSLFFAFCLLVSICVHPWLKLRIPAFGFFKQCLNFKSSGKISTCKCLQTWYAFADPAFDAAPVFN